MAWDDEPEGSDLQSAYQYLVNTYKNTVPDHTASLQSLVSRPISG